MISELQLQDRLILERAKQLGIPKPSDAEVEACARAELRAKAQKAIAALQPITLEDLAATGAEFEKVESRGGFYDLARELIEKGYVLQGCILLLATWNAARFSKVHFDIDALQNALADLRGDLSKLARYSMQTLDLELHRNRIEAMFNRGITSESLEKAEAERRKKAKQAKQQRKLR